MIFRKMSAFFTYSLLSYMILGGMLLSSMSLSTDLMIVYGSVLFLFELYIISIIYRTIIKIKGNQIRFMNGIHSASIVTIDISDIKSIRIISGIYVNFRSAVYLSIQDHSGTEYNIALKHTSTIYDKEVLYQLSQMNSSITLIENSKNLPFTKSNIEMIYDKAYSEFVTFIRNGQFLKYKVNRNKNGAN